MFNLFKRPEETYYGRYVELRYTKAEYQKGREKGFILGMFAEAVMVRVAAYAGNYIKKAMADSPEMTVNESQLERSVNKGSIK